MSASHAREETLLRLTGLGADLNGKRLELLKETIPALLRVGVLWDPSSQGSPTFFKEIEVAAGAMKVQLQSLEVRRPNDIESAFKAANAEHTRALVVLQSGFTTTHRPRIVELRPSIDCQQCSRKPRT